jgi:MFS family permease
LNSDTRTLLALGVYHCINDGSLTLFASALPVMRIALGLDFVEIGTILGAGLLATMLLQPLFGSLADRGHAARILVLGFAGIVIVDLIFPVGTAFTHVLVFYVLLRSAAAVYHPVGFASVGRIYITNKTRAFGYQGAVGDLGLTLATFSTGILSEIWGWRVPFWVWGGIAVVLLCYFAITINRHRLDFYAQHAPSSGEADDDSRNIGSVKMTFAILALVSSITTASFILFTGYMPLYFNIIESLSPAWSTTMVAAWIAIGVLAGLMTGRIVGVLGGESRTLQVMFAMETILFLIANVSLYEGLPNPSGFLIRSAVIALTGIPVFVTFPAVNGLLGMRMPRKSLGFTYALNLSLGLLVASASTYLVGYLASVGTIAVMLPMLLIIGVLGTAVSLKL